MSKTCTKFIIAIDAGGTGSRSLAVDINGKLLGKAKGEPINITQSPESEIRKNLSKLYSKTLESNNLYPEGCRLISISIAGWYSARWNKGKSIINEILQKCGHNGDLFIELDLEAAWAGASNCTPPAIVVYSGTGSFAIGKDRLWNTAYADIFGPLLGDSGSGYWIGCKALRSAVKSLELRGTKTMLESILLDALEVEDLDDLVKLVWEKGLSRNQIASLVPKVVKVAINDDKVSKEILTKAAKRLAISACAVTQKLPEFNNNSNLLNIYYSGGIFKIGGLILRPFEDLLQSKISNFSITPAKNSPLIGALLLGYKSKINEDIGKFLSNLKTINSSEIFIKE